MNFIDLSNRYWKLHQQEAFMPSDTHVYWCLVNAFNGKGSKHVWPESMAYTDGALADLAGVNSKTMDAARARLVSRGLITTSGSGQGKRMGVVYRLTSPTTSVKNGEVTGEVNGEVVGEVAPTYPKNGEVNEPLLQQLPPLLLQQPIQKTEKFYIYIESKPQTPDNQTIKHILFVAYRSDACVLTIWFWLLKNKKKENPQKRTDPFLRKRHSELANVPFSQWWQAYQKGIKEDRCRLLWIQLTDEERTRAMDHTPAYVAATPQKQYRKNPENYLDEKVFNDEIIDRHGNQNQTNPSPGRIEPVQGKSFGNWKGTRFGLTDGGGGN